MFKFIQESLVAQILLIIILGVIIYIAGPKLLSGLGGIFNLYDSTIPEATETY